MGQLWAGVPAVKNARGKTEGFCDKSLFSMMLSIAAYDL